MRKGQKPRKILYSLPTLPIASILWAARQLRNESTWHNRSDLEKKYIESLVEWAEPINDAFFKSFDTQPRVHKLVYDSVFFICAERNQPSSSKESEEILKGRVSRTGVRGSLSRLVERGLLVRPAKALYWPAGIVYPKDAYRTVRMEPHYEILVDFGNRR